MSVSVFIAVHVGVGAASGDQCIFPPGLHEEISKKHPNTTIVSLADLEEYDRTLYSKDHGTRCPGLLKVDFYGDGKPTWALVLMSRVGEKRRTELIVAKQVGHEWQMRSLGRSESTVPVVWSQGPGRYQDVYGKKTIRAMWPVIVFCGYESWAILYSWTGKEVLKVWLSD